MKVLYKLRFVQADSDIEEAKNIAVTLDSGCKILAGLQAALDKLKKDAAAWKIVSVRRFDEDFGEYVDSTDDDVIEGLAKYEAELEPTDNAARPEGNFFVKFLTGKTTTVTLLSR
ncbi:hypothetical protein AAVH_16866 [Aphelenchoides avenae]|nr:hypothetical protein AAVH_16866 [Aphelenchus avenae]